MTTTPQRRWFAYSLRTLFLVVTTFAVWLGYEWNWIRQRHSFSDTEAAPWVVDPFLKDSPGLLGLFGEPGYAMIFVEMNSIDSDQMTTEDRSRCRRAKSLFPEALLYIINRNTSELRQF